MCTVTWVRSADGYALFVNRDELATRGTASPPRVCTRRGVRYLAPADAEFGGTWIAVNELGVALCLLNGYADKTEPAEECTSRGLLVADLADATSVDVACTRLAETDLTRFRPFVLAVLEPNRAASVARWNGRSLAVDADGDSRLPLVSSSFDPEGVAASRSALFLEAIEGDVSTESVALERFHAGHAPERGPYSVCMHREDASTVSFSAVSVDPERVTVRYIAGSPCSPMGETIIALARRRSAGPRGER